MKSHMIHLRGNNGRIDQVNEDVLKVTITDPVLQKTYNKTYEVPIHDLSRWMKLLEITSTSDGGISFGDWFE